MVQFYYGLIGFLLIGVLWFYVVRPMLEGFGLIAPRDVSNNTDDVSAAQPAVQRVVMSNEQSHAVKRGDIDTGIKPVSISPTAQDREVTYALAGIKTVDGWRFSANAIYALVKGNRNDVMGWVRSVRGNMPEPADEEIVTPWAGRRTKAAYYPDTPELEYEPPRL